MVEADSGAACLHRQGPVARECDPGRGGAVHHHRHGPVHPRTPDSDGRGEVHAWPGPSSGVREARVHGELQAPSLVFRQ
jgi:hypothetical protein